MYHTQDNKIRQNGDEGINLRLPGVKRDSIKFDFFLLSAHEYNIPYQLSLKCVT